MSACGWIKKPSRNQVSSLTFRTAMGGGFGTGVGASGACPPGASGGACPPAGGGSIRVPTKNAAGRKPVNRIERRIAHLPFMGVVRGGVECRCDQNAARRREADL